MNLAYAIALAIFITCCSAGLIVCLTIFSGCVGCEMENNENKERE